MKMTKMATIDILMATYNGGKFIREQLDSIFWQTFQDFRLIVRDDGSTDDTVAIVEEYSQKNPGRIEIVHDEVVCKSATKNFFELLKHAEADYVMFCDQDDVWMKYKIQITLDYMKATESRNPGKPVLIFTGLQVVDAELRSMDLLFGLQGAPEKLYTFRELLAANCAAGCTQMLNREAYENLGSFEEGITLHDWWTMLYALGFGVVERVPMALILYRQHSGNVMSAKPKGVKLSKRILQYTKHPFELASKTNAERRTTIEIFHKRFAASLSPEKRDEIEGYLKLFSKNFFERCKAVRRFKDLYLYTLHSLVLVRLIFLGDK